MQTAFIGDVVLALPVLQRLRQARPEAELHFLVRKGNESLCENHPAIDRVWVRDKSRGKLKSWRETVGALRKIRFDAVVNLHRHASSGGLVALLRAKEKRGFAANPFSFAYTRKYPHKVGRRGDLAYPHEVDRNLSLLSGLADSAREAPRLYPSAADEAAVAEHAARAPYFVVAPASVWFTKQWPEARWAELIAELPETAPVFLVGAPGERPLCNRLAAAHPKARALAGELSLLQTAALMRGAARVFCNDSAPLHLASAVGAPATALFCSTIPEFGFGPLAPGSHVAEVPALDCRPCGLHGFARCPEGHFRCAKEIRLSDALKGAELPGGPANKGVPAE